MPSAAAAAAAAVADATEGGPKRPLQLQRLFFHAAHLRTPRVRRGLPSSLVVGTPVSFVRRPLRGEEQAHDVVVL